MIAEYYLFDNRDTSGATRSHRSWAGFAQAGRTFGLWTLYGRFEKTDFDQGDSYFNRLTGGRSYEKGLVGVRYELTPRAALKLEFSRRTTSDPLRRNESSLEIQYSAAF